MTIPEIYVLRHGETEWNRAERMQGGLDSPLTARGRRQAREMGRVLAAAGVTPKTHRVYSSPQPRAVETARLALGARVAVEVDDRLREIGVGAWAGLSKDQIFAATPGLSLETPMLAFYEAAPDGEPFGQVWARAAGFLADLDGPAIIVTHGITSRFLRTVARGGAPEDLGKLPGGQGVVYRVRDGRHERVGPSAG